MTLGVPRPPNAVAALALALFAAGGYGLVAQLAWWRPVLVTASVLSAAVVLLFWDGIPTSPATFALAFDAIVLVALVVAHWPSEGIAA